MDLYSIAIAQRNPANQFRFDEKAFDQSIVRGEERRARLYAAGSRCRSQLRAAVEFAKLIVTIARPKTAL